MSKARAGRIAKLCEELLKVHDDIEQDVKDAYVEVLGRSDATPEEFLAAQSRLAPAAQLETIRRAIHDDKGLRQRIAALEAVIEDQRSRLAGALADCAEYREVLFELVDTVPRAAWEKPLQRARALLKPKSG